MANAPAERDVNPLHDVATAVIGAAPVARSEHQEDFLTRMLEHQAAKIPSNVFLFGAFCALVVSFTSELTGNARRSRFVGMWVGPLLTMGVYTKLVKTFGAR